MPAPGTRLERPLFDVSTKLESTDRYLSWDEASEISGLSGSELEGLKKAVFSINDLLTKEAARVGLINEDGKVEFGFDEKRNLLLLDTVGTLDECRFTFNGLPVSKEILRRHYRGCEWYNEVEEAKKNGGIEWKKLVKSRPEPLPQDLKRLVSEMYKSACNEITGKEWFKGVNSLKEILKKL
jgi:phosphoribosylaminoimidazole-succinocarboxamide synthase